MRTLFCSLLLAAFPPADASAPISAEAAFDLYARTMLQDDPGARREFDARIGPALGEFRGRHPEDSLFADGLRLSFPDTLFDGTDADDVKTQKQRWTIAVQHRTQCHATHSDTWHRISDGLLVADIRFTCQVADVDALRMLFDASLFNGQDRGDTRFWSAYRSLMRDGPLRAASGSTRLVVTPGSTTWHSEGMGKRRVYGQIEDDVGKVLMDAWLPMRQWTFETLSRVEQRMTLVAECDELVHQYRRCAARFAPQELVGADALAKALSDQHGSVADSELVRQCKVLRPKIDALWPEPCE